MDIRSQSRLELDRIRKPRKAVPTARDTSDQNTVFEPHLAPRHFAVEHVSTDVTSNERASSNTKANEYDSLLGIPGDCPGKHEVLRVCGKLKVADGHRLALRLYTSAYVQAKLPDA